MYKLLQKIKKNSDMRFHDKYHIGCNKCSSNKGTPSHTLFEKKKTPGRLPFTIPRSPLTV